MFSGVYLFYKKSKFYLLSVISLIVYCICFNSFFQINTALISNNKDPKTDALTVLTFNTQGFKHYKKEGKIDIDQEIIRFIQNKSPDIFCIQEFAAMKYKFFKEAYPNFFKTNLFAAPNKSVMAIFSKYPIINKGFVDFPDSDNGAMFVDVKINNRIIRVYNLHLESYKINLGSNFNSPKLLNNVINTISHVEKKRKGQAEIMNTHIEKYKGKVIICGDFNSTPFSSVYRLIKNNYKDSFIESGYGLGKTFEFYKYPFRLDYVLVDNTFDVVSHENFNLKLSDHEPVFVKLALNN
ncbi:endonuclease/exonuclease/phosphatase family protein [Algibacter sp. PT7-4]|uniref:endonuclease/exonuclease/phosphatase family protein n=1 Tax=Algibacter ulvanivorans TaxID=3400999 RepID=UPI003AAD017E